MTIEITPSLPRGTRIGAASPAGWLRLAFADRRALLRGGVIAYLALLHLVAGWGVWTSKIPGEVAVALGWVPDWVEFDQAYKRRVATLRRLDAVAEPGALVFLGDSHVASLDAGALADHPLNYGIGGDTTRRVVVRLDEYKALGTARAVLLHVGVNDVALRPIDRFEHIYRRIVAAIPAGVPLIASAILPTDERSRRDFPNERIARYNEVIRALCAARPGPAGCRFVEGGAAMADGSGNLAVRYHVGDGVHLSADGYKAWIAALRPALAPYAKVE